MSGVTIKIIVGKENEEEDDDQENEDEDTCKMKMKKNPRAMRGGIVELPTTQEMSRSMRGNPILDILGV